VGEGRPSAGVEDRRVRLAAPLCLPLLLLAPTACGASHRAEPALPAVDELTVKGVKRSIGGSVHDPTDPVGRLLFNVLAMVAELESDLIRART